MQSCIYEGHVRHRRFAPVENRFRYRLFLMYLDLAELPGTFSGRWLWSAGRFNLAYLRRRDHLGDPALSLDRAVRDLVEEKTGARPAGPVRLLTHLRYWGYCFNPVSFYYCYDREGRHVETIVAEVSNTPWREMHPYVLGEELNLADREGWKRYRFPKVFHVSPFMEMDITYDWRFRVPGRSLSVHMDLLGAKGKVFDATLTASRREITGPNLARVLILYPFMTLKVISMIHYQAFRLWRKKATFHPHPKWGAGERKTDR